MKNENFELQNTLEANYLNVRLHEPVELDEIAVNVVKRDCPEFLIPFHIVDFNGSTTLKYRLLNTVALEYSNMTLRKAEFIRLYQNLLIPFIRGKDWFLDYHSLCIDSRFIFLDKSAEGALYIYIPEKGYRNTDEEILDFFRGTLNRATITDDAGFQVRLFQYFSRKDVTLVDLFQLIQKEDKGREDGENVYTANAEAELAGTGEDSGYGKNPVVGNLPAQQGLEKERIDVKPNPWKSGIGDWLGISGKDKNTKKSTEKKGKSLENEQPWEESLPQDSDEVMKALFGNSKKKDREKTRDHIVSEKKDEKKGGSFGFFGKKKEKEVAEREEPDQRDNISENMTGIEELFGDHGLDCMETDMEVTEIGPENPEKTAYLELIESPIAGALSKIGLDFTTTYITIGRASSDEIQPDVAFGREFMRIGRRHARIEKKGEDYFVIDLGSANHTLLNGQILIPNQPYQMQDGGELTFTDSKPVRYRIHL